jgi:hypothetical protein
MIHGEDVEPGGSEVQGHVQRAHIVVELRNGNHADPLGMM